jgi:hypothetical protein
MKYFFETFNGLKGLACCGWLIATATGMWIFLECVQHCFRSFIHYMKYCFLSKKVKLPTHFGLISKGHLYKGVDFEPFESKKTILEAIDEFNTTLQTHSKKRVTKVTLKEDDIQQIVNQINELNALRFSTVVKTKQGYYRFYFASNEKLIEFLDRHSNNNYLE